MRRPLIALWMACLIAPPATAGPAGGLEKVRHVVVFLQENRSFDHYFGALRGVRGFADAMARPRPGQPDRAGRVLPFPTGLACLEDLPHDWASGHQARHGGAWDRWLPAKGTTAMAYHARADLPFHYALADAYTVCDAYFASVLGPTNPNRLYAFTGTLDPRGAGGGPVTGNAEPEGGFRWTTYPERLEAAGVSWKVYQEADTFDDNPLPWFAAFKAARPGQPLYDRGLAREADLASALARDVRAGTLPRVAWIIAPTDASEHPPHSPANGARLTRALLAALGSDPAVARSTVFLLGYDEDGGFYDHVPPPTPPPGTPDEFVAGEPIGLGVRVPLVIVSPWTRGGRVCSRVFDHTSILRFLEAWTGVPEPNLSAWRRAVCGDLTEAFDFDHPDFTLPDLPEPEPVACPEGVRPPVPEPQAPPVQESGSRPWWAPEGFSGVGAGSRLGPLPIPRVPVHPGGPAHGNDQDLGKVGIARPPPVSVDERLQVEVVARGAPVAMVFKVPITGSSRARAGCKACKGWLGRLHLSGCGASLPVAGFGRRHSKIRSRQPGNPKCQQMGSARSNPPSGWGNELSLVDCPKGTGSWAARGSVKISGLGSTLAEWRPSKAL